MTIRFSQITVIGSGAMGHGIALVCAQGGLPVILFDINETALQAAQQKLRAAMAQLIDAGLAPAESLETVLGRIAYSNNMQSSVQDADLVFEAVPEKAALKASVYAQLETYCKPEAIFASNTSGIPINTLAAMTKRPERFVGTHFFMPAHLIPLVEVVQADKTQVEVIDSLMQLLRELGKQPVHVRVDIPGFIANRLQHALAREAMSLVEKGVASIEDIDAVVKTSLAVRLLFTGPIEQRDFNGLDIHLSIAEYLYQDLEDSKVPLSCLKERVVAGQLGIKSGKGFYDWTDKDIPMVLKEKNERLIAALKLLQQYDD